MDKLKKIKHEHTLTDLLKFVIFSLIMLAPFFSIGGRMAYTIFNKNAKDSYSQKIENQYVQLSTAQDFPIYGIYLNFANGNNFTTSTRFNVDNVKYNTGNLTSTMVSTIEETTYLQIWRDNNLNANYITWQNANTNVSATIYNFNITFDLIGVNLATITNAYDTYFYSATTNNSLDNAFDYSISKIADQPVFNWVKNTAIYDGINAMLTGLEYETDSNPIAIMCAYWLLNTAVYMVIDIVVWAFTKMTHMFIQE